MIILSDDILVSSDTSIVSNGSTLEICPVDDFLYSVDCGKSNTAKTVAQNLREHLDSLSTLHIEHQIIINGE